MRIQRIRALRGPNPYSHQPVLVMTLDLEDLAGQETCAHPDFLSRLDRHLPGIGAHVCGLGFEGAFARRLQEGTYFAHVVEHVALELSDAAGISVNHGKTRQAGGERIYDVIVEYRSEAGMRKLLALAVEIVNSLLEGRDFPIEAGIAEARRLIATAEFGPSTRALVEAAERRGIPWRRLGEGSLVQLGYGKHRKLIQAAMTSETSAIAVDIASNKELTKQILSSAGIPTPCGIVATSAGQAIDALEDLRVPLAVKPADGNQGKGVTVGVRTADELRQAFAYAMEFSSAAIVEEQLEGNDYRVLVVGGKVVAASQRTPAQVEGDGTATIRELIDRTNLSPMRGEEHEKPLTRIAVEPGLISFLERRGLSLDSVPPKGQTVALRECANLSKGGAARDVTSIVHPEIAALCERAALLIGLDVAGIDLITEDIAKPLNQAGGVVEVNAAPGLRMHHFPSAGEPRDAAGAIIGSIYPDGSPSRIPIAAITGTNGKTTVTRLVARLLASTGLTVGMTTTDGIWIGNRCVARGDLTGPQSARAVLADPTVEAAVLETARGGIARHGLGYDWADVAVITNIQADHIGQDGIESLDDILHIKSLVAERLRDGGGLVLNADDPLLRTLPERNQVRRVRARLVWFSMNLGERARSLLTAGGTVLLADDGWIVEATGHVHRRVLRISEIPLTLEGVADFQVANVLAAAACARLLGVDLAAIRSGLMSFASEESNRGRMNFYRAGDVTVVLDYGHNAPALNAVCRTVSRLSHSRLTGVIGIPGDRCDDLIRQAGQAACGFDRIILREDQDLRGRRPGEVAQLLRNGIEQARPGSDCEFKSEELEAVEHALRTAVPGEVVVIFSEHPEQTRGVVQSLLNSPAELCVVK